MRPEPLTDPDMNLSIHPARANPRKRTGFRQDQDSEFLPLLQERMKAGRSSRHSFDLPTEQLDNLENSFNFQENGLSSVESSG